MYYAVSGRCTLLGEARSNSHFISSNLIFERCCFSRNVSELHRPVSARCSTLATKRLSARAPVRFTARLFKITKKKSKNKWCLRSAIAAHRGPWLHNGRVHEWHADRRPAEHSHHATLRTGHPVPTEMDHRVRSWTPSTVGSTKIATAIDCTYYWLVERWILRCSAILHDGTHYVFANDRTALIDWDPNIGQQQALSNTSGRKPFWVKPFRFPGSWFYKISKRNYYFKCATCVAPPKEGYLSIITVINYINTNYHILNL